MNRFSIKDIENLSGIKAHTLRVWEQRYNICIPKRKESNHRFYDSDDLKSILKVSYLYHRGLKISKIAKFDTQHLNSVAETHFKLDLTNEHFISRLVDASIDLDEVRFEVIFQEALLLNGLEVTISNIIYPYLERIGVLWLTDNVIPAQEHFTSNIINRKIILAIDRLPNRTNASSKTILLFAPEKEHHEIPLLFLHYLLKKNGNHVIYFGVNTKLDNIKQYTDLKPVSHLHLHLITNLTSQSAGEYIDKLTEVFPGKKIVISGPFCNEAINTYNDVRLLKSRDEVMSYVQE
jgi:DNA-binding transcriptional MerR regulator